MPLSLLPSLSDWFCKAIICQLTKVAGLLSYCLAICHGFSAAAWVCCRSMTAAISRKLSAYRQSVYAPRGQQSFLSYYGCGHASDLYPNMEAARREKSPRSHHKPLKAGSFNRCYPLGPTLIWMASVVALSQLMFCSATSASIPADLRASASAVAAGNSTSRFSGES